MAAAIGMGYHLHLARLTRNLHQKGQLCFLQHSHVVQVIQEIRQVCYGLTFLAKDGAQEQCLAPQQC